MNPKPFSSLNHLTTPVAIQHLLTTGSMREGVLPGTAFPHASTASGRTQRCRYTSATAIRVNQPVPSGAAAPPSWPASGAGAVSGSGCGAASYWSGSKPCSPSAAGGWPLPVSGLPAGSSVFSSLSESSVPVVSVAPGVGATGATPGSPAPVSDPPEREYLPKKGVETNGVSGGGKSS